MAKIAIKGHETRGKEVIELLEMLGGENIMKYNGSYTKCYYFLDDTLIHSTYGRPHLQCYTLEEFLKKYPYKVGDKVVVRERGKVVTITDMSWRNGREIIYETLFNDDCYECFSSEELQPYKEQEPMDEQKGTLIEIDLTEKKLNDKVEIILNDDYEVQIEDGRAYIVKKQPQYPKSYEECCKILDREVGYDDVEGCKYKLFMALQRLIVCRDAYWKLEGDWKPNLDSKQRKFALSNVGNKISFEVYGEYNSILCFPTEEMRDAFYENFKELINECKELL